MITKNSTGPDRENGMEMFLGKVVTISGGRHSCLSSVSDYFYIIEEDGGKYAWTDYMIEGLAEAEREPKEGEEVLARDEVESCAKLSIYLCTIPGKTEEKYICVHEQTEDEYERGDYFCTVQRRHIKQLPEPEKKVTIELTEEQLEQVRKVIDL